MREEYISIGELARKFEISASTLRYYEKVGLLTATERRGTVRYYGIDEAYRLAFIQLFAKTGLFSLEQIAELLNDADTTKDFRGVLTDQVRILDEQIAHALRARQLVEHFLKCDKEYLPHCPVTRRVLEEEVDGLKRR